ncbi:MAG: hypothetical protein RIC36_01015 [Rhodospirillales bacterium]
MLLLLAVSLLTSANGVVLNVWMDRDLSRAADYQFLTTVQGPESGAGLRSPGGGFYAMLAAAFAVAPDIISAARLQAAMLGISCLLLAGFVYHISESWFQSAVTVTIYATSGAFREFQTFWNPGFIPLFAVLLTALLYHAAVTRRAGYVCWFLLVLSFSMQIHQQVLLFLPVCLLICVIWRPVWSRWSVMLAVTAFILPIAPYIVQEINSPAVMVFGADRSVWDTPYVSSPVISPEWLADRLGVLLALGGGNAASVDGLFGGRFGALLYHAFRVQDILLVALLVAGGGLVLRRRRPFSGQAAGQSGDKVLIVLTTSIICVAIMVLAAGTVVTDRHIVFAAPGFAILTGWVVTGLVGMISRDRLREPLIALLYFMISLKILFFALIGFTGSGFDPSRYAGARTIHEYIVSRFGWSYEMTAARLAVFNGSSGSLIIERLPFGSFFMFPTSQPAGGESYDGCLAVISKDRSGMLTGRGVPDLFLNHPQVTRLAPVLEGTDEIDAFYFVRYRGLDGNCLKAATNAYLYREPLAGADPDSDGTAWRRVDDPHRPLPLWLGMTADTGGLQPVLDGRELRGHTGFNIRRLERPYVEFRDSTGRVAGLSGSAIPFAGGRYDDIGTMGPWRLPVIAMPEGIYSLTLGFSEKGVVRRIDLGDLEVTEKPDISVARWRD